MTELDRLQAHYADDLARDVAKALVQMSRGLLTEREYVLKMNIAATEFLHAIVGAEQELANATGAIGDAQARECIGQWLQRNDGGWDRVLS